MDLGQINNHVALHPDLDSVCAGFNSEGEALRIYWPEHAAFN